MSPAQALLAMVADGCVEPTVEPRAPPLGLYHVTTSYETVSSPRDGLKT